MDEDLRFSNFLYLIQVCLAFPWIALLLRTLLLYWLQQDAVDDTVSFFLIPGRGISREVEDELSREVWQAGSEGDSRVRGGEDHRDMVFLEVPVARLHHLRLVGLDLSFLQLVYEIAPGGKVGVAEDEADVQQLKKAGIELVNAHLAVDGDAAFHRVEGLPLSLRHLASWLPLLSDRPLLHFVIFLSASVLVLLAYGLWV
ncbi:hypothetical protein, partial [Candidatus Hakubella thermalkaliphila]|uniref:hypothetical protein n=1 Tax=Candidatus Hakubella thermalkaliphila TaxID=2754717 RepID=UPI001C614DD7